MSYRLQDLIDMEQFQRLQDRLNEIYSFPSAIIDNDGTILTATAWQDICTKFHRRNKECELECIKSDQYIIEHLPEANPAVSYRCPHGLIDNATPIIINGRHLGNFFTGQFFLEKPDLDRFRRQAAKYGFDEAAYIDAVRRVPVWTQEQLNSYLFFIKGLIEVIASIGLKNLTVIEAGKSLQASEERHRSILQTAMDGFWLVDAKGRLLQVNDAYCRMSGYSADELLTMTISDLEATEDRTRTDAHMRRLIASGQDRFETKHRRKDGSAYDLEVSVQYHAMGDGLIVAFLRDITDRKKAEEALWQSRNMLDRVLNTMPQSVFWKDRNSVYLGCNNVFARAVGLADAGQISGKTDFDLPWPRAEAEAYRVDDREVMEQNHDKRHIIEPLQQADGSRLWIDTSKVPLTDSEGQVFGILGVYEDITDRKRAEAALKESELRLKALIDAIPDAVVFKDVAGRHIIANRANETLFGLRPDMMIGKTAEDLLPAELAASCRKNDEEVLKGGRPVQAEERSVGPDGKEQVLDSIKVPLYDDSGTAVGLVGLVRDVTSRRRAEEKLRENEQFIRNILESVDEGFIVVDRDYRILSANRAFCRLHDLPEASIIGRSCYAVSHHRGQPCHLNGEDCPVKRTLETGTAHSVTHQHATTNGGTRYMEIKSYPITDGSGSVTSVIETSNDITETRKLEDQLRQSQKMEAIGTLAGGVAHDFNNILTAIIGYANIVKMKMAGDDPQQRSLDQILDASGRAARLTQGLLAFSRKQAIVSRPVDLNRIVSNVEGLLQRVIGEDIDLAVRLFDGNLIVMADSGQIEQVLMNLAVNARDAMPEGGAFIITTSVAEEGERSAGLSGGDGSGRYALISVSDTGEGMDERTREKIFEPFFTTKEQGKGTGLGLAIVYGIIKQHDGTINVYSEPGKGTTFRIYLPLTGRSEVQAAVETHEPPRRGTETVLLAEDEESVRKLMRHTLEEFGYRVIFANDGQEAIQAFTAHAGEIDLVILDVIMPKKSGKEVYDVVRSLRPNLDVLFISGYTADIISKKGIFEENIQLMTKPLSPYALLRRIRTMLDRKPE